LIGCIPYFSSGTEALARFMQDAALVIGHAFSYFAFEEILRAFEFRGSAEALLFEGCSATKKPWSWCSRV
jgi:hypothetical protein